MFQVGGNAGSALGPLAAAIGEMQWSQPSSRCWPCCLAPSCGISGNGIATTGWRGCRGAMPARRGIPPLPRNTALRGIAILLALIFSKYVYLASLTSYFTFYLIHRFGVSAGMAQLHLFAFLGAVAVGTIVGGPLGDKFGRKYVICFSILGALPFTLRLPHVSLFCTGPLTVVIGLILASAFPPIAVFAQELVPARIGMISGLFFGFSFGMGGLGAAVLRHVADRMGITAVYAICAFLSAIGMPAAFLPYTPKAQR
jgi:FSR family fosmidomycin resistance protein-like MFS transporter